MAKSKIIWSNRAIKRLYAIFEFHISKNGNKAYPKALYKALRSDLKLLGKYPDLGLKTNYKLVRAFPVNDMILFYEPGKKGIIIHTLRNNNLKSIK